MKRNLIALFAILVCGSLTPRMTGPLDVCGVRPGMTRAQVERILEYRSAEGGLLKGPEGSDWFYHVPHSMRGCHCGCPRVNVTFERDVVVAVTGWELRQGWWVLARQGDALPSGLPWVLREGRAELPAEHLTVRTDGDCERGNVFVEATLTR